VLIARAPPFAAAVACVVPCTIFLSLLPLPSLLSTTPPRNRTHT
jgi:hypothetical protein